MTLLRILRSTTLACALVSVSAPALAQATARMTVRPAPPDRHWTPIIEVEGLLQDETLRDALNSGLPLRFRLRVELWANRFFDRLEEAEELAVAILEDPLDGYYVVTVPSGERRYPTISRAATAIGAALHANIQPPRPGRYYYLATLEVETLSLSDLEELRRWLRGDVGSAVEGRSSPESALESGLRRVLVRVIGLPTRRMEARSGTFRVP